MCRTTTSALLCQHDFLLSSRNRRFIASVPVMAAQRGALDKELMQVDDFELAEESPAPPARAVRPAPSPTAAVGQAAASGAVVTQLLGAHACAGARAPGGLEEGYQPAVAAGGAACGEAAAAWAAADAQQTGAGGAPRGAAAGAGAPQQLPAAVGDAAAGPGPRSARAGLEPTAMQQRHTPGASGLQRASPELGDVALPAADGETAWAPPSQAVGSPPMQAVGAPRAGWEPAALQQRRASGASRLRRMSLALEEGACGRRSSAADGAGGRCACSGPCVCVCTPGTRMRLMPTHIYVAEKRRRAALKHVLASSLAQLECSHARSLCRRTL